MFDDYISITHEMTNELAKIMYEMFPFYIDLYGTKVNVERFVRKSTNSLPTRDQMMNKVYGKVASNDLHNVDDADVIKFDSIIIINKTDSEAYYNNNGTVIQVYCNTKEFDKGDKISYNRYGKVYSFKVTDYKSYEDIIFEYELTGIKEFNNESN